VEPSSGLAHVEYHAAPMSVWVWVFTVPWVLVGVATIVYAFASGRRRGRGVPAPGGGGLVKVLIPIVYVVLGLAVPAIAILAQEEAVGGTRTLAAERADEELERGKDLFRQNCAGCHTLAAVQAKGVTGPNLDRLGNVSRGRVLAAISNGGTGKLQMPAGLLEGENAEAVAAYVSRVAGK
jgi:hypothetical protein